MINNLIDKIKALFPFLLEEYGFIISEQAFSEEAFGNEYAILESSDFRLRLVKDRGQFLLDIGSHIKKDEWFDFDLVRVLLLGLDIVDLVRKDELIELKELSNFLKQNYVKVKYLFSEEHALKTIEHLKELEKKRASTMFPQAFE